VVPVIILVRGSLRLGEVVSLLTEVVGAVVASYALRYGSAATLRYFGLGMATSVWSGRCC
jgi:hypothetical protein